MKNKERFLWATGTILLILTFIVFSISFTVKNNLTLTSAEDKQAEVKDYMQDMEETFNFILGNYVEEVDPKVLYEGAMSGLFESLEDPHSTFLTEKEIQDLTKNTLKGEYGGVGLYIQKKDPSTLDAKSLETDKFVIISAPIEGTPGFKAGLHALDMITHIDDEPVDEITIDETVSRLTGPVGTDVKVSILRKPNIKFDVVLTRAKIEVPTVKTTMINDDIFYIKIISWSAHTPDRIKEALQEVEEKNIKQIIVDVRNNPGGLLNSVTKIADFFLSKGKIVSTKGRTDQSISVAKAYPQTTIVSKDVKVAVLMNEFSASASEIFAGAMKDSGRAKTFGTTTYGKGSVQIPMAVGNTGYKLTTSLYYSPSGRKIDKQGVEPDFEVKEKELSEEEINSLQKLFENKYIENFLEKNSNPSASKIDEFLKMLRNKEIILEERLLRKLIQNEINRSLDFPPIIDIEFDIVLRRAMEFLETGK
ncbi:MAG: S41 family peptidase [Spirochaetales bacterium]|nr:S41 family peptidase [Spirochaetales bacterium]